MLVLMSLPDAGSRLGQYFHTVESPDGPQQKLILIRLAEVPPSDTFADLRVECSSIRSRQVTPGIDASTHLPQLSPPAPKTR